MNPDIVEFVTIALLKSYLFIIVIIIRYGVHVYNLRRLTHAHFTSTLAGQFRCSAIPVSTGCTLLSSQDSLAPSIQLLKATAGKEKNTKKLSGWEAVTESLWRIYLTDIDCFIQNVSGETTKRTAKYRIAHVYVCACVCEFH